MRMYAFVAAAFLTGAPVSADLTVTVKQSECIGQVTGNPGEVLLEVEDCTLVLRHLKADLNCCLEYQVGVELDGASVEIVEKDAGPPCDCICPFDLEARIDGLAPGFYTVTVRALRYQKPLTFEVEIPECGRFILAGDEVWSHLGIMGVVVPIRATNPKPLEGFSFGTTYPLKYARMAEINLKGTITEQVGAEFTEFDIHNEGDGDHGWATCVVILDHDPPFQGQTIPPGVKQPIANLVYDLLPPGDTVPRSIGVPFMDGLGKPPVAVAFTVDGTAITPETHNGIIQIKMPPPEFIRGDANDNGEVNISDPIYLLEFLFAGGSPPPCEDAADANDDGKLDLADAVAALTYLFGGGTIPPPSPPGPPGPDPTLDPLGCAHND